MGNNLILEPIFQPGDVVKIKALERPGRVGLIRYDGHEVEFFVNWWDGGQRRGDWLHGDELEAAR